LFNEYTREELDAVWDDEKIENIANQFLDRITVFFSDELLDLRDGRYHRDLMEKLLNPLDGSYGDEEEIPLNLWSGIAHIFRGTFFMSLLSLHYYFNRIKSKQDAEVFEKVFRSSILELVDELREKYHHRIGTLSEDVLTRREIDWVKDVFD